MRVCVACALALLLATPVWAATHVVDPDGSGDFPTIQAALNAADEGDVIELIDGRFVGDGNRDIDFLGKAVTVESQSGNPEDCVIDCGGSTGDPHRGFLFVTGEGRDSVLRAITIQNAYLDEGEGAGVLCQDASPTFESVVFENNIVFTNGNGGGMFASGSPLLTACVFRNNSSLDFGGGGLYLARFSEAVIMQCWFEGNRSNTGAGMECSDDSAPVIQETTFLSNEADFGGGVFSFASAPLLQDCFFIDNSATVSGGALTTGGAAQINNCTFSRNVAPSWGGAVYAWQSSAAVYTNCTFTANRSAEGSGSYCSGTTTATFENCLFAFGEVGEAAACEMGSFTTMTCCNLFDNDGGNWVGCIDGQGDANGNVSLDPQFCSSIPDDQETWTLQSDSPCAAAQSGCGLIGAWDVGCETTATFSNSWGELKARFDDR